MPGSAPPHIAFGEMLRRFRLAVGLTQEQLAEKSGLSTRGIRHLEAGDRTPRLETVHQLAIALDLDATSHDRLAAAARPELSEVPSANLPLIARIAGPSRLPIPLTSLVGRHEIRQTIAATIARDDVRLLTLSGPPGVGKTRLLIECGRDLEDAYDGSVAFVPLAAIADPSLLIPVIFQALGGRSMSGVVDIDTVVDWIGETKTLLLLDNFEHLLSAASVIPQLLSRIRGLNVIVTSRSVLRVSGEHVLQVPPLSLTTGDEDVSEAERLFIDRARALDPGLDASPETTAMVRRICQRLDGLPLAIELAAGQLGHQTIAGITSRTEGMLELLNAGPRDQSERLQAMTSSLEWSYALLSSEAQSLFRRLAVFRGGFTSQAAYAIGGYGDDVVRVLVDANLVIRPSQGARPRFGLLELIREFAGIRLMQANERDLVREAHARFFYEYAERVERKGWIQRDAAITREVFEELPNIREALQWLDEQGDGDRLLRMVGALPMCWTAAAHRREGQWWIEHALEAGTSCSPLARSKCHVAAEQVYYYVGDAERAIWHAGQACETAWASGDPFQIASTGILAASSASYRGDYQEALRQCELGLRAAAEVEDEELGTAIAIWFPSIRGRTEHGMGQLDAADRSLAHAIDVLATFENPHCATRTWCAWGTVAFDQGRYQLALERYARGADIANASGDETLAATNLRLASAACALLHRFDLSARLLGAIRELERRSGPVLARNAMDARAEERGVELLQESVSQDELERKLDPGRLLSLPDALDLLREQAGVPVS